PHAGQGADQASDNPLQRWNHAYDPEHSENAKRPEHRQPARGRDKRHSHHDQVKYPPGVTEEIKPPRDKPRRYFHNKHTEYGAVEQAQESAEPLHCCWYGFQSKSDRIDYDQHSDRTLKAARRQKGFKLV